MDQLAELLFKHHPDFASWLLSNRYTKNVTPGQLRSAFPTLRMHRTGDAILNAFNASPTQLRAIAAKSTGFASGSPVARLAAPAGLGGIAALRRLGPMGAAATVASMVGPEIYDILKEDSDAKRMVEDMDRNREMGRMLDRELRRPLPSERPSEDRQRMLREMEAGRASGRRIRMREPEMPLEGMSGDLQRTLDQLEAGRAMDRERMLDEMMRDRASARRTRMMNRPESPSFINPPDDLQAMLDELEAGRVAESQRMRKEMEAGRAAGRRIRMNSPLEKILDELQAGRNAGGQRIQDQMLAEMEAGRAAGRRIRMNRPEDPIELRPIDLDISLEDALGPSSQDIIEDDLARLLPQILPRTVELERNFIPKRQITVPPVSPLRGRR